MTRSAALKAAAKSGKHTESKGTFPLLVLTLAVAIVAVLVYKSPWKSDPEPEVSDEPVENDVLSLLKDAFTHNGEAKGKFNSFSKPEFWEKRYEKTEQPFDWYTHWGKIQPLVADYLPGSDKQILNIGCGNSQLPTELHADGYTQVTNTDISNAVIEKMSKKYSSLGQRFMVMDVTQMSFSDESFDLIIDKGTLDALYSGAHALVTQAVTEIERILRPGGVYISITFGPEERRQELKAPKWASFETKVITKEHQENYVHIMVKPPSTLASE